MLRQIGDENAALDGRSRSDLVVPAGEVGIGIEPDAQLGFLWNTITMGTLLSIPLLLFGVALIVNALRHPPTNVAPVAAQ